MNNQFLKWMLAGAIVAVSSMVQADDTDIYIANDVQQSGGDPMVMFSLDYRPDLTSNASGSYSYFANYCSAVSSSCTTDDVVLYAPVRTSAIAIGSGGFVFLDTLRLSLEIVLLKYRSKGLKIGLMFNHN